MSDTPSNEIEKQNHTATKYATILGAIPSSFSIAVRQLMADDRAGCEVLSEDSEFQIGRLLRGPTALAALYFASKTFYPDKLKPGWLYTPLQLAHFYSPSALAGVLAFTYLFKRCKRIVHPEDWLLVSEQIQRNSEITTLLGLSFPEVGPTRALIGGGIPFVAGATFLAHDRKGYAEYRRYLRTAKNFVDPEYEIKRWGCTSVQVATAMLVALGFGVELAHEFSHGFARPAFPSNLYTPPENGFTIVRDWLEELHSQSNNRAAPEKSHQGTSVHTATPELAELLARIARNGSQHRWLEKKGSDIGPDTTPDLLPDVSDQSRFQTAPALAEEPVTAAEDSSTHESASGSGAWSSR